MVFVQKKVTAAKKPKKLVTLTKSSVKKTPVKQKKVEDDLEDLEGWFPWPLDGKEEELIPVSESLWNLANRIEDCSYDLIGAREVITLYAESDGVLQRPEALWLAGREIERIESLLIDLADRVMHYKPAK